MDNKYSLFALKSLCHKSLVTFLIPISLMLIMGSCVVDSLSVKESQDVRLLKAKDWFEMNEIYLSHHGAKSHQSEALKIAASKINKKPDWDRYLIHIGQKGEEVWEIPLIYEGLLISVEEGKPFPKSVAHSMVMFSQGSEYKVFILKVIPDDPDYVFKENDFYTINYKKKREDFSGVFKFFEWDESFIGGYVVENGQTVRNIIRKD